MLNKLKFWKNRKKEFEVEIDETNVYDEVEILKIRVRFLVRMVFLLTGFVIFITIFFMVILTQIQLIL